MTGVLAQVPSSIARQEGHADGAGPWARLQFRCPRLYDTLESCVSRKKITQVSILTHQYFTIYSF